MESLVYSKLYTKPVAMYAVKAFVPRVGLAITWLAMPYLADRLSEVTLTVRETGENFTTTEAGHHCDKPRIEIVVVHWGSIYNSGREDLNNVSVSYGHPFKVSCFGSNPSSLTMVQDGIELPATQSRNKIEWYMGKAKPQKVKFTCIDTENNCEEWVSVSVTPAMEVLADRDDSTSNGYVLQYGNPLTVLCSGSAGVWLTMMKDGEELETTNVKEIDVTIKWFEREPNLQISEYKCTDANTGTSYTVIIRVEPYLRPKPTYHLVYGNSNEIEVFCSGPRTVKLFTVKGGILHKKILSEKVNETTVKSFIGNLKLGQSTIACIDGEVPDYKSTIIIKVTPRLEVSSPEIHRVKNEYYVKHGDPLEIVCSGPNASQLTISEVYPERKLKKLNYTVMNETAIKWCIKNDMFLNNLFACYEEEASTVFVSVYTRPMASNFRCASENLLYLKCFWTSFLSYSIDYTLFYMENGKYVHICTKSGSRSKEFCVWSYQRKIKVLRFLMQSCNIRVGCFNQTFLIDHVSIIKPDPPKSLTVDRTSRLNVIKLIWNGAYIVSAGKALTSNSGKFQYKVEYEYPGIGIGPVAANSSLVSCYEDTCLIRLKLPCPGQFYTFRVYQKLKTAVAEEYWSEPSSVTYHSDLANGDTDIEKICNSELSESKEVVLHSLYNLNNEVVRKMQKLRKKVVSLEEKRATIHAYIEQQRKTDEL